MVWRQVVGNLTSWASMVSGSNNWGMGNNRSMSDNRCVCYNRSSMGNNWSSICRSSLDYWSSISRSIRVDSCSFIGDIGNISIIFIGVVFDMLSASIRKSNRARSRHSTSTIRCLISIDSSI